MNVVRIPREEFEYQMVPWIGRKYAAWLRASARPHPADEHRLVLVPERIYQVFRTRAPGKRASPAQLKAMGHPRLPEDDELCEARQQQMAAAAAGDMPRVTEIHHTIEALERRLEVARNAVERWRRADPEQLEERIAWELARAPHTDVLVGIQ